MNQTLRFFGPTLAFLIPYVAVRVFMALFQFIEAVISNKQ